MQSHTQQKDTPGQGRIFFNKFSSDSLFVEETLNEKKYEMWLVQDDIVNIARIEYGWYSEGSSVLFKVIGSEQDLKDQLKHYQAKLEDKRPVTFVIDLDSNHWATLFIFTRNKQLSAYYIDSSGNRLPEDIDGMLKNTFPDIHIDESKVKQQTDLHNCGIFALENARIINEKIQNLGPSQSVDFTCPQLSKVQLKGKRKKFAESLRRREKIEIKFKALLSIIEKLNKNPKFEPIEEKFNHETGNIILFFLETVALQDYRLRGSDPQDPETRLFKYQEKLLDQGIIEREDFERVRYIRTIDILHRERESIIDPSYFDQVIKFDQISNQSDNKIKDFFRNLEKYVRHINEKLQGRIDECKYVQPKQFFKSENEIETERRISNSFDKIEALEKYKRHVLTFFQKSAVESYGQKIELENIHENLFDFLINVVPFLEKVCKGAYPVEALHEIKKFRGEMIHNFYYCEPLEMCIELKKFIRKYKHYFFKYSYSQIIFDNLKNKVIGKANDISHLPEESLKLFQTLFKGEYISDEEDIDKDSFEIVPLNDIFPELDNKAVIENCVAEVFELMCITDSNEAVANRKQNNINNVSEQYFELRSCDRRIIYDDFKKLRNTYETESEKMYAEEKEKLQKKFGGSYRILEDDFNAMIKSFIENKNFPNSDDEIKIVQQIVSAVIVLKEVKNIHHLSNQDIKHAFNNRQTTNKKKRETLNSKMCQIPENTNRKVEIPNGETDKTKTVTISTDRFAINMFEMFCNKFIKYSVVFDNIQGAFNDEMFLACLEKEEFDIDQYLAELVEMEYVAPYITKLLTNNRIKDDVLTVNIYESLIGNLLKNAKYLRHLKTILETKDTITDSQKSLIYEKISNSIANNGIGIRSMHCILDTPEHVYRILILLIKNVSSNNDLYSDIIKLLNSIACELYKKEHYNDILNLFEANMGTEQKTIIQILIDHHALEASDLGILKVQHIIVQTKLKLGNVKDAGHVLEAIEKKILQAKWNKAYENEPNKFYFFLLILSDKAYVKFLQKNYDKAYELYDCLYKKMFSLFFPYENASEYVLTKEDYITFKNSKDYKNICILSSDTLGISKYLDILKIKCEIAYQLKYLAFGKENTSPDKALDDFKKALDIYNEVYDIKQKMHNEDSSGNLNFLGTIYYIAFLSDKIAKLLTEMSEKVDADKSEKKLKILKSALEHRKKAQQKYEERRDIFVKEKWDLHPGVKDAKGNITLMMLHIGNIHIKIADVYKKSFKIEETIKQYKNAVAIYQMAVDILTENLGEKHQHTLNNRDQIAYSKYKLLKVTVSFYPRAKDEAIKYCNEILQINEEILQIQTTKLGAKHAKTEKTKTKVDNAKRWLEKVRRLPL